MIFSAIVAVADNNVIGREGNMPWPKMSGDLKYFKNLTNSKWCILGRKSYNALGNKVLPGRKFIVVTRDKNFVSADSIVVHDLNEAFTHPALHNEREVMILGGGEIYRQALPHTNRVYLTRIEAKYDGDAHFPELLPAEWQLASAVHHTADEKNPHAFSFLVFDRK